MDEPAAIVATYDAWEENQRAAQTCQFCKALAPYLCAEHAATRRRLELLRDQEKERPTPPMTPTPKLSAAAFVRA